MSLYLGENYTYDFQYTYYNSVCYILCFCSLFSYLFSGIVFGKNFWIIQGSAIFPFLFEILFGVLLILPQLFDDFLLSCMRRESILFYYIRSILTKNKRERSFDEYTLICKL